MKKGEKAQVYIIAAVIIIIAVISLAAVTNYASVREKPQKFYDMGSVLKTEGKWLVDYSVYNNKNTNENMENYLKIFQNYTAQNINEDFTFMILYGNSTGLSAKVFNKEAVGTISYNLGSNSFVPDSGTEVVVKDVKIELNPIIPGEPRTASITIPEFGAAGLEVTRTVPVLEDNNFIFIMTTSEGLNQYIQSSLKGEQE